MPREAGLGGADVVVRRAEPGDYEGICSTFDDESVYAGTLQVPFPSKEMWRKRLAEFPEGDFLLVACVGDEVVGNAGLHGSGRSPRRAHAMNIGLCVRREWQGRGVGRALMRAILELADNWLNVIRLELTVFADNERAIALYREMGFEPEGTHKAYALRAGHYVDALFMARIRMKPGTA